MPNRFRTAAPPAFERRVIEAGYVVGGRDRPLPAGLEPQPVPGGEGLVSIPVLAVGGIRTPPRSTRSSTGRRRPGRHRPAVLRRARPRRPHPRRRRGAGPVPQLQPVRARPDARHEGRLLQPRRRGASRRGDWTRVRWRRDVRRCLAGDARSARRRRRADRPRSRRPPHPPALRAGARGVGARAHGRRHASRCSPAGGSTTTRPGGRARAASGSTPRSMPTR